MDPLHLLRVSLGPNEPTPRKAGHDRKESAAACHVRGLRRLSRNSFEARMAGLHVLKVHSIPPRRSGQRFILASSGREVRRNPEKNLCGQSTEVWANSLEAAPNPRVSVFMTPRFLLSLRHLVRSV